jgi:hypothetical protein
MTDFLYFDGFLSLEDLFDQGVALVSIGGQYLDLYQLMIGKGASYLLTDTVTKTISRKGHHGFKMMANSAVTFFIFLSDHRMGGLLRAGHLGRESLPESAQYCEILAPCGVMKNLI